MEQDADLPEGWSRTTLEELCIPPQYGWTTSGVKNGSGLKLLRTTDISSGEVDWPTVPECEEEPAVPAKYLLREGDIVVSRAGSVGISYLVQKPPRAVFASYLIRFRPKPPVTSEFIRLFLNSPDYWTAIAEEAAGIAVPNVNASKLKALVVPLPPLQEQRRMVATVGDLLRRVDQARDRLTGVPKILKALHQSVLAAACSGRLTEEWREKHPGIESAKVLLDRILGERRARLDKEPITPDPESLPDIPSNWCSASVDQILSKPLANGRSVVDRAGGFPVLRLTALKKGRIDLAERKEGAWTKTEAYNFIVQKGDFLVSRGNGSLKLVGRGGLVDADPDPVAYPDTLIRIRSVKDVDSHYLAYFWDSPIMRSQIESRAHTTAGIHKISQKDIAALTLPLPPLHEQHEIVRRVEALFKLADAIEKRVELATKRAEKLTQAILAKAFRGELVPTEAELARREGRSYEPTSALLERIKAERAKSNEHEPSRQTHKRPRTNAS